MLSNASNIQSLYEKHSIKWDVKPEELLLVSQFIFAPNKVTNFTLQEQVKYIRNQRGHNHVNLTLTALIWVWKETILPWYDWHPYTPINQSATCFLLASHFRFLHPIWHPPSHSPLTLSHWPGSSQCELHVLLQLFPKNPSGHSGKKVT